MSVRQGLANFQGVCIDCLMGNANTTGCCHAGQYVPRQQIVHGIEFTYQPPPRHIVPQAAALKGQGPRYVKLQMLEH